MKLGRKFIALGLGLTLFALCACGSQRDTQETSAAETTSGETTVQEESTAESDTSSVENSSSDTVYTVGICQLVQHDALDNATLGFKDALVEEFGEDGVVIEEQNAGGDAATCTTICTNFVSEGVDLIMANATASLQAAAAATDTIPILGTSITDYGVALDLADDYNGTVGGNISGTSDCAPLDEQADMIEELFPDATEIGIIYCSAEPNSKFQSDTVQAALEADGLNVTVYTFSDSNDLSAVTQEACSTSDVIYIPTDNTAAAYTETINNVALPAKVPIIAGEEGIMSGCGVATLSISYYNIGHVTGEMAVQILRDGADISTMPIQYDSDPVKEYMPDRCEELSVTIPDDYTAYEAEG